MNAKLIHNPKCSKSRQTKALLEKKRVNFEVVEYLKNPLNFEELDDLFNKLEKAPEEVVRKKEQIYKELGLANKKLSRDEWIKTIESNPTLLERPIFINKNKAIIGRPPEDILAII